MRDALLLLDRRQFFGVVTLPPVGDQHPGIGVADHLADLLVAMLRADLEHRRGVGHEDHQLGIHTPDPPARVIGVGDVRAGDLIAQGLIPLTDRTGGAPHGILCDR